MTQLSHLQNDTELRDINANSNTEKQNRDRMNVEWEKNGKKLSSTKTLEQIVCGFGATQLIRGPFFFFFSILQSTVKHLVARWRHLCQRAPLLNHQLKTLGSLRKHRHVFLRRHSDTYRENRAALWLFLALRRFTSSIYRSQLITINSTRSLEYLSLIG